MPCVGELGENHDGTAEFPRRVSIRTDRCGQLVLPGKIASGLIVSTGHAAGIESLHRVNLRCNLCQIGRLPGPSPPPVKRMGDAYEGPLRAKFVNGLSG